MKVTGDWRLETGDWREISSLAFFLVSISLKTDN
jgi:hypothetical protein